MKNQETRYQELISNDANFFKFMGERYPIFNNSNLFLRDIQYAIRTYFQRKNIKISYTEAEELMKKFTQFLENEGKITRINYNAWKMNFSQ